MILGCLRVRTLKFYLNRIIIAVAERTVFNAQGAAIIIRKRVRTQGMVNVGWTAIGEGFGFSINRTDRAFFNTEVAGLTILSDPAM